MSSNLYFVRILFIFQYLNEKVHCSYQNLEIIKVWNRLMIFSKYFQLQQIYRLFYLDLHYHTINFDNLNFYLSFNSCSHYYCSMNDLMGLGFQIYLKFSISLISAIMIWPSPKISNTYLFGLRSHNITMTFPSD